MQMLSCVVLCCVVLCCVVCVCVCVPCQAEPSPLRSPPQRDAECDAVLSSRDARRTPRESRPTLPWSLAVWLPAPPPRHDAVFTSRDVERDAVLSSRDARRTPRESRPTLPWSLAVWLPAPPPRHDAVFTSRDVERDAVLSSRDARRTPCEPRATLPGPERFGSRRAPVWIERRYHLIPPISALKIINARRFGGFPARFGRNRNGARASAQYAVSTTEGLRPLSRGRPRPQIYPS